MKMVYFCNFALRWIQSPFDSLNILCDFIWLSAINFINESWIYVYEWIYSCCLISFFFFSFHFISFRDGLSTHKSKPFRVVGVVVVFGWYPGLGFVDVFNAFRFFLMCKFEFYWMYGYVNILWSPNGQAIHF